MLEMRPLLASVVICLASAAELDRLRSNGAFMLRVAPNELLLVSRPGEQDGLIESVRAQLADEAVVVDQTDAFAGWTLSNEDVLEAFSRLSALPLGEQHPRMQQGLVAGVPAKIIAANGDLHLLVPSILSHHVRERILDACADLDVREGDAAVFNPTEVLEAIA